LREERVLNELFRKYKRAKKRKVLLKKSFREEARRLSSILAKKYKFEKL